VNRLQRVFTFRCKDFCKYMILSPSPRPTKLDRPSAEPALVVAADLQERSEIRARPVASLGVPSGSSIIVTLLVAEKIAFVSLSAARTNADRRVLRVPRADKATQRNLWGRRRNWYDDFAHEIFNYAGNVFSRTSSISHQVLILLQLSGTVWTSKVANSLKSQ
jgi:hypothetical protein